MGQLQQGENVPQFARNQARTQINNTFDTIRPRIESALTARGFGGSGKMGASFKNLEFERAKGFQNAEADLRSEAQRRFLATLGLAQNFLQPRGFDSSTTSTGSGTAPGQSPFSAIGGAFGDIGGLIGGLLGGSGSGGGGSSDFPFPPDDGG